MTAAETIINIGFDLTAYGAQAALHIKFQNFKQWCNFRMNEICPGAWAPGQIGCQLFGQLLKTSVLPSLTGMVTELSSVWAVSVVPSP